MTDIPLAVLDLCSGIEGFPCDVTEYTCVVHWHGLELRFQKNIKDKWEWDEIVGSASIHIEQMDDSYYWMGIHPDPDSDTRCCVNIGSKSRRAPVSMNGWVEEA